MFGNLLPRTPLGQFQSNLAQKWRWLLKCRWTSSHKPYMTVNLIVQPLYKGAIWKFRILTAHLQNMSNHIREYQLSTPENLNVTHVTNFTEKWILTLFFDPHSTPRDKIKIPKSYCTSTIHIQWYYLLTLWNVDGVHVTTTLPKILFDSLCKNENSKYLLCIYKTCPIRCLADGK